MRGIGGVEISWSVRVSEVIIRREEIMDALNKCRLKKSGWCMIGMNGGVLCRGMIG